MAATPAVTLLPPAGGWCAALQVPSVRSEEALVLDLVERDGVLVHPGYFFDFPREAFVVVEPAGGPRVFDAGVSRLLARVTEVAVTAPAPRQCGIGVPLFSIPTSRSWGIGEFTDSAAFGSWCVAAGQRYVQLLPLNEISPGETSPYSSMTAMALDRSTSVCPTSRLAALGGEEAPDDRGPRPACRGSRVAAHPLRRGARAEIAILRRAYRHFVAEEIGAAPPARSLSRVCRQRVVVARCLHDVSRPACGARGTRVVGLATGVGAR